MRRFLVSLLASALIVLVGQMVAAQETPTATPTAMPTPDVSSLVLVGHSSSVTVLAWSPDGSILASSAGWFDSTDPVVRLWTRNGSLATELRHDMPATALDWSPDSKVLATGSYDQKVRLWSADGKLLNTIEPEQGIVFGVDWSPDGKLLASASLKGTEDNTIQIWTAEGELLRTLPTKYSGGKFLNVGWSPDGKYLAGGATDYHLWKADGAEIFAQESCAHCTPAWGFAWSPDSTRWAVGNESGVVWVYDTNGTQIGYMHNSAGNVDIMAWSPDGKYLLGGNAVWEWTGSEYRQRSGVGNGRITALVWSPDSTMIATGSVNQHVVTLWNLRGRVITRLQGHTDMIEKLAWSPDGDLLASAGDDHTVRLWDVSGLGE